jgi:hypothetical protein
MKPVFVIFENQTLKVFKNSKKNLDVDNKVLHWSAKSQHEILCIQTYTKMTNPDKSEHFQIFHCLLHQI